VRIPSLTPRRSLDPICHVNDDPVRDHRNRCPQSSVSCAVQTRRRSTRPRISTSDKPASFWSYRRSLQRAPGSSGYAPAATRPTPDAYCPGGLQVVDRWHL
jgi:hypothetical protein